MDEPKLCYMCGGKVEKGVCTRCLARVSYNLETRQKEIVVSGEDHDEVSTVTRELMQHHDKPSLLSLLAHWSFWFGTVLALLGVVLVVLGSQGETEFSFFGQTFKSQNVGIASFFLGAALVVLNVHRILKSYDKR
ncbi:MAG: hypothetical protein KJ889_06640 [Gammaproteobacteria bacterium]|nr:hypothetical protein [Gammaproteobacteria bacterium]